MPVYAKIPYRTDVETVIHSDNDFATVAYMRIKSAELEAKPESTTQAHVPSILDADYEVVYDAAVEPQQQEISTSFLPTAVPEVVAHVNENSGLKSRKRGNWIAISNIETSKKGHRDMTIEEEVTECFSTLEGQ